MGLKEIFTEIADAPRKAAEAEANRKAGLSDFERGAEAMIGTLRYVLGPVRTALGDNGHILDAVDEAADQAYDLVRDEENARVARGKPGRDGTRSLAQRITDTIGELKDLVVEMTPEVVYRHPAPKLAIVLDDATKHNLVHLLKIDAGLLSIRDESGPIFVADDIPIYGESDWSKKPKTKQGDLDVVRLAYRYVSMPGESDERFKDRQRYRAHQALVDEAFNLGLVTVETCKGEDGTVDLTDYVILVATPGTANAKAVAQRLNDRQNAISEFRTALRTEAALLARENPFMRNAPGDVEDLITRALKKIGETR